MSAPSTLVLERLTKSFGSALAVDSVSLHVPPGNMVALLGPSGCGKTTTLRMIAGLLQPTSGEVIVAGRPMSNVPIHQRNVGMVFQQYALFPHMSVFENVAYGLRERRTHAAEVRERVAAILELVGLTGFDTRRPRELSGGQQQRVALARALVIDPELLLLDEPLSNLDAKLRKRLRIEIKNLQQRLGITTIFVTHDQEEALEVAHTIVVMRSGRVEQIGTPAEIYGRPATAFVADFIGECNIVPARMVEAEGDAGVCEMPEIGVRVRVRLPADVPAGEVVAVSVRPERLRLAPDPCGEHAPDTMRGKISDVTYRGATISYKVVVGATIFACDALSTSALLLAPGQAVAIAWDTDAWQALR